MTVSIGLAVGKGWVIKRYIEFGTTYFVSFFKHICKELCTYAMENNIFFCSSRLCLLTCLLYLWQLQFIHYSYLIYCMYILYLFECDIICSYLQGILGEKGFQGDIGEDGEMVKDGYERK